VQGPRSNTVLQMHSRQWQGLSESPGTFAERDGLIVYKPSSLEEATGWGLACCDPALLAG